MPRNKSKRGARRSSMRDRVKKHAKDSRRGSRLLDLPEGVEIWYPEEKCTMEMDIIPYEVSGKHHPDEIAPGELWYRRPYFVHFIERKPVVCPRTVGKKCPICEMVDTLRKDYEANKEMINGLKAREMCLFNFVEPGDKKKTVKIFDWSSFKFAQKLEQELDETDDLEDCGFADPEGGSTIKFRISEDSFGGSKYYVTTRLDFRRPRRDYDESTLDKVVDLDKCFRIKSYQDLVALLSGGEDEEEEEEVSTSKKKKKSRTKKEPEPEEEDFEDEDLGEDDDWDDDPEEDDEEDPEDVETEEDDDWDDDPEEDDGEDPEEDDEEDPEEDDEDDPEEDDDDWDEDEGDEEDVDDGWDEDEDEPEEGDEYLTKEDVVSMNKEDLLEVIEDNFADDVKKSPTALKRMSIKALRKLVAGLL